MAICRALSSISIHPGARWNEKQSKNTDPAKVHRIPQKVLSSCGRFLRSQCKWLSFFLEISLINWLVNWPWRDKLNTNAAQTPKRYPMVAYGFVEERSASKTPQPVRADAAQVSKFAINRLKFSAHNSQQLLSYHISYHTNNLKSLV